MSSERPGEQPSSYAAGLQPEDRAHAVSSDEREPTWEDADGAIDGDLDDALIALHHGGFSPDESTAEEAAHRLDRIAQDHAHIEMLRHDRFEGPNYELFKTTLALYGYPVMRAWIRRRQIWSLTAARGRAVRCRDAVRDHLARDLDDRQELAMETVAKALVFFREHALIAGKWTPSGGANITTFFAGACIAVFPNVCRAWLKEYEMDQDCDRLDLGQLDHLLDPPTGVGPEDRACQIDLFETALKAAGTDRLRRALASVVLTDAQYAEIAEDEGTSEEAIKQLIYRFRRSGKGRIQ
jgi:DNA-directed RNA polymerase specialized sigma24 family protein